MLTVHDLTAAYENGNPVLHHIDLRVERGEILCLLGPSGCGKTTLLRVIAGLENPQTGTLLVEGERITNAPVHKRGFGFMFQNYALFPHMDVADNVMFGLKMRRMPKRQRQQRVTEVLDIVGLSGYEKRRISQLSGGQQQRVALARSLAPNPRLLMLDEPLASLDEKLSRQLVIELRKIIKSIGLTSIYVTHNQQEAFAIADRVAVMNAGQIEQIGTPRDLYERPATVFVAKFLGLSNILPIEGFNGDRATTLAGEFLAERSATALLIHPRGLHLVSPEEPHALSGAVTSSSFQRGVFILQVEVAPGIIFTLELPSGSANVPEVGQQVALSFADDAVVSLR